MKMNDRKQASSIPRFQSADNTVYSEGNSKTLQPIKTVTSSKTKLKKENLILWHAYTHIFMNHSIKGIELFCESYIRWLQSPTCNSATPRSSALATGKGTHLVQTMYTCVQGNTRPCTRLSGRHVHSSVHCALPFRSAFRRSWWFVRT